MLLSASGKGLCLHSLKADLLNGFVEDADRLALPLFWLFVKKWFLLPSTSMLPKLCMALMALMSLMRGKSIGCFLFFLAIAPKNKLPRKNVLNVLSGKLL